MGLFLFFACITKQRRGRAHNWIPTFLLASARSPLVSKPCAVWCSTSPMCNGDTGARSLPLSKPTQELIPLSSQKDLRTCFEVWAQAYVSLTDFLHWRGFLQNVAFSWHLLISLSRCSIPCASTPNTLDVLKTSFKTLYWAGIRIWKQGSFMFAYFIVHCSI